MAAGDIELTAEGRTLATRVRAKYPGAYDDLSDADLEAKIKAKYPGTYDDLPTSTKPSASATPVQETQDADRPVTLGDVLDHPKEALAQMGHLVKRDVTDPKTWLELAAIYAGPKVIEGMPSVARAVRGPMSKGVTAVGNALDNPAIGAISPRARNLGEVARVVGKVMEPPAASNAPLIAKLKTRMDAPDLAKNPQARAALANKIKQLGGTP